MKLKTELILLTICIFILFICSYFYFFPNDFSNPLHGDWYIGILSMTGVTIGMIIRVIYVVCKNKK
jgi:hypothetical protein